MLQQKCNILSLFNVRCTYFLLSQIDASFCMHAKAMFSVSFKCLNRQDLKMHMDLAVSALNCAAENTINETEIEIEVVGQIKLWKAITPKCFNWTKCVISCDHLSSDFIQTLLFYFVTV